MLSRFFFPRQTAKRTWEKARDAYLDAIKRGDTRAIHATERPLIEATNRKLEVRA